jgi:hypothetical protein
MDVIKAAETWRRVKASLLETSLTRTVLAVTCCLGLVVWVLLDVLHQRGIEQVASEQWYAEFEHDAAVQRGRIKHAIETYFETAQYLAGYPALQQQLQRWNRPAEGDTRAESSVWQPNWLASVESLDGAIEIDYAVVYSNCREMLAS